MKKMKFFLAPLMIVFLAFSTTTRAQWTDMEWEEFGIEFKAPTEFTVTQDDEKAFTAKGAIFTMSIKPWKDASITDPVKICQRALDITPGTKKKVISEAEIDNLKSLEGYAGYCTAIQNGKLMHIVIGGYLNPNNSTNFTVQLLFWDDPDENETNFEAAMYMLESFKTQ